MPTRTVTVTSYDASGAQTGSTTTSYDVTVQQDNRENLSAAAATALATNRTFLALATPTNVQLAAQVQALARQNVALIRLVLGLLDGTS